jgi:acylphosphatase
VIVHGWVQGVGFRYAIVQAARSRRISGWVMNRTDGTVEAVFEGGADAVDSLVRLCREGPHGAEVERAEVSEAAPEGLSGFEVR